MSFLVFRFVVCTHVSENDVELLYCILRLELAIDMISWFVPPRAAEQRFIYNKDGLFSLCEDKEAAMFVHRIIRGHGQRMVISSSSSLLLHSRRARAWWWTSR